MSRAEIMLRKGDEQEGMRVKSARETARYRTPEILLKASYAVIDDFVRLGDVEVG